jgi:hypothetical protein
MHCSSVVITLDCLQITNQCIHGTASVKRLLQPSQNSNTQSATYKQICKHVFDEISKYHLLLTFAFAKLMTQYSVVALRVMFCRMVHFHTQGHLNVLRNISWLLANLIFSRKPKPVRTVPHLRRIMIRAS